LPPVYAGDVSPSPIFFAAFAFKWYALTDYFLPFHGFTLVYLLLMNDFIINDGTKVWCAKQTDNTINVVINYKL
jgi:hypothetical protein